MMTVSLHFFFNISDLFLVEDHGIVCRSISTNEKFGMVAIGGCASKVGRLSIKPFISVHRINNKATFPVLDSQSFPNMDGCITNLEFIPLAKKPTLLATDNSQLAVFCVKHNELTLLNLIKLHTQDINCLSYFRMNIFTGGDDKTIS